MAEPKPDQTADTATEQPERDAIMRRIEETVTARPALGVLLYGVIEHLDRIEDEEVNGELLLAMLDFARKHPDFALILALLGRYE